MFDYPKDDDSNREEIILSNVCHLVLCERTYHKIVLLLQYNEVNPYDTEISNIDKHLQSLPELMLLTRTLPRHKYRFSETLELFLACCYDYQHLVDHLIDNPKSLYEPNVAKELLAFLNAIKHCLCSPQYTLKTKTINREAQSNFLECAHYVDDLFSIWSKLVVIRLDLGYESHINADIEDFKHDFNKLYTNARHNRIFNHLCGYILKIEYGLKKKLHTHLILFFNGHKRKGSSDVFLAEKIGEYWNDEITKGRGWYWNCNDDKEKKYRFVGIGLVQASDMTKRKNLLKTVEYLCKKKIQVIKPISNPRMKSIRKGQIPKSKLNLGRTRMNPMQP
jgi:hypothetical protein